MHSVDTIVVSSGWKRDMWGFVVVPWLRPFLLLPHPRKMQESRHCSMRAVCLEEMLPLGADHQALHQGRVGEESLRKPEDVLEAATVVFLQHQDQN